MLFAANGVADEVKLVLNRCNIMFLHAETTAQSRLATYSKNGSAEHLFALIDLCILIERHKKFIFAGAGPRETEESEAPHGTERNYIRHEIRSPPVRTIGGRDFRDCRT
jgi:hypothetical protein